MSEFVRTIDPRFYDQPGFADLEYAWCQVFAERDSSPVLDPTEAQQCLKDARDSVARSYGLNSDELGVLESVASRYARESTAKLNFELEELL